MTTKKIISSLFTDLFAKISNARFKILFSHIKKLRKKLLTQFISLKLDLEDKDTTILLDLNDKGITKELLYGRMREKKNVSYLIDILKKNNFDAIIDIGANIGFFVLVESSYYDGNIVAIEPVKRNFNILMSNIYLNHLEKRIVPLKLAIGDEDKTSEIYVPDQGNWSSLIKNSQKSEKYSSEKVNIMKLATLFNKFKLPKENLLLRCDIEGFEYNLIKGNKEFFKELKNVYLVIEFHTHILKENKSLEFLNLAEDIGFKPVKVIVDRPYYIYLLPKFLHKLANKIVEWKIKGKWLKNEKTKAVSYNDLRESIIKRKKIKAPHLYFYKK